MDALELLDTKVDLLLKKYAAVTAENKLLRTTIAGKDKTIEQLGKKLLTLENSMVSVHITPADEDEKNDMRLQLDNVIAEIDRILKTLND